MSRIGKNPIAIPEGVTVEINNNTITVKGKLGELSQDFSTVDVKVEEGQVLFSRNSEKKDARSKHGLYRALVNNMILGVSKDGLKSLN